ncbi:unnamed protein product, partial [Owenia fusiformis]
MSEEDGATLAFWMKIVSKNSTSDMYYFSSGDITEMSSGVTVLCKNETILTLMWTSTKFWKTSWDSPVKGMWHHLIIALDKNLGLMEFYVDGVKVDEDDAPDNRDALPQLDQDVFFGRPKNAIQNVGEIIIDEVMFWNNYHGFEFAKRIYNMYTDHVYYMPMEETQRDVLVGSGLNAKLVEGKVGKGINLNGVNQWIDLGQHGDECFGNLEMCPHGYTLSMWLKVGPNNAPEMYYFSSVEQNGTSYGIILQSLDGKFVVKFSTKNKIWRVDYAGQMKGQWYHVVLTWNREDGLHLWIDGHAVATDEE